MQRRACIFLLPVVLLVAAGCAGLPEYVRPEPTYGFADTQDTYIGTYTEKERAAHEGQSGFVLLADGLDAFVARAVMAGAAEKSIDVQYYLYHPDLVGGLLAYKLLKAADRGVRVRVLLDDIATDGRDLNLAILDSHPYIAIRLFNPFVRGSLRVLQYVTRFGQVTKRMHNKSFTVDNQLTIVGGRNIGNEYFAADPEKNFGDLDVLAIGPVVQEVSGSFDKYWNSELSYPVSSLYPKKTARKNLDEAREFFESLVQEQEDSAYLEALGNSELAQSLRNETLRFFWGRAEAIYDQPEKITQAEVTRELLLAPQLAPYIDRLDREMIILSAYFVPGWVGVKFLQGLASRGIRIRIVTNSLASTDVSVVHAGYAKYRRDLLRAGIELYEVKKDVQIGAAEADGKRRGGKVSGSAGASLHAKSFVLDRETLFIGSFNFDPRSYDQNTEIGIVFHSPELGAMIGSSFDENILSNTYKLELVTTEDGDEIIRWIEQIGDKQKIFYREPGVSVWRRLFVGFASLLPIEGQL